MNCFHCNEAIGSGESWSVELDKQPRALCCTGCAAVMQAIIDAGLADYYKYRTEPAVLGAIPDNLKKSLDELAIFDEHEVSEQYLFPASDNIESTNDGSTEWVDVNLSVEGMRCGACVWVLEKATASLPGVESASFNYSTARASVRFDAKRLKLSQLLGRLAELGYRALPFDAYSHELSLKNESRAYIQRLFVAGIATMQVMMYALPAYLSDSGDIEQKFEQLLRWASLLLTIPVLLYSAQPFIRGAWRDMKELRPSMDVPISLGVVIAFLASVWATLTGHGETYFDSVSMFVFLILGARYLEWAARRKAIRATDSICAQAPDTAQRLDAGKAIRIPAVRLRPGDTIRVDQGERIPVDARIEQGNGSIDNALITGESVPVTVTPGDLVSGGALVTSSPLTMTVVRVKAESTLSVIDRMVQRGVSEKPQTVQLADRIAVWFVTVLLLLATAVYLTWLWIDPGRAAFVAIAVLVVSCPCALSLATPSALAAATAELLRQRILVTRGHALETMAKVTDVVFDKTGTLTRGKPTLTDLITAPEFDAEHALQLALILETGSSHPYAAAIRNAGAHSESDTLSAYDAIASLTALGFQARQISHNTGCGVCANLECGAVLMLGSASWCGLNPDSDAWWNQSTNHKTSEISEIFLVYRKDASDEPIAGSVKVLARYSIQDAVHEQTPEVIAALKETGITVHLLSGDRSPVVAAMARQLCIEHHHGELTPAEKQSYVQSLQNAGRVVLMVGDGINDAPVLACADVSLATGNATALAQSAADLVHLGRGIGSVAQMLTKARSCVRIIRQNLMWATCYNLTAIPFAAIGWIPPWAAAIGMAGSSLLVVGNAQRLWLQNATDSHANKTHQTASLQQSGTLSY